jgi:iron complex transport system substrate-binding protein
MKKVTWLGLGVLMVAAMLIASCSTSTTTSTPMSTTTTTVASTTAAGPVALTVTNGSTVKTYSLADLQALTPVTGNGGMMGKGGTVTGPFSYQGVALTDLLNAVGGVASGQSVTLTGSDGYTKTLTYDQITSGGFDTYDTSGNPVTPTTAPVLAVVYSQNGAPLDSSTGPLELGLLSSQNLVSAGNMWVKLLVKIDITTAQ